jgi:hypothetical protein
MPKVPMVRLDDWDGVQLPRVMSVSDAPLTRGRHVLAHGIADAGRAAAGIADVAMRVRERRVREEETALVDSWRMTYGGVWEGRPGDTPEAEPVRGVRDWGEDEGSAVDAMRETWLTWRDDPDGPYMKASAEARRRADRRLMLETNRIFSLAAQKDLASAEIRRRTAAEASLATGLRTASLYAHDDGLFEGAAADAADAAARLKAGRFLANPSETDPEKLRFTSESGAALYHAARAEAMDRLNHTRALTLIKSAGTAEDEARAAAGIAAAAGVAEMLPPALKADTLAALESARAKRLDGMLGLARAEPDLDKRERLARIAEDAAKAYGAGGKLLGAVTEEANRIRAGAQEAENRLALAALAEGREYEPGDNPRKAAALAFAKPKYEKLAAQAHRKAQDGNALFIGSMVGAGVWADPEGNIRPVTLDESRGLLVAQLEAGNIGLTHYHAQKARLDKIEASGRKARYERAAAEVADALGETVGTVWADGGSRLASGEDPERKLGRITVTETEKKLVPEMEEVDRGYTGGLLFGGGPSVERRKTGRMVERERTVTRKRELLARDVPKLVDLLVAADDADGLMADLDGNPATPDERLDARRYKLKLLNDLKARQTAVDLDAQAEAVYDALARRRSERAAAEAEAILRASVRGYGAGAAAYDGDDGLFAEDDDHADD